MRRGQGTVELALGLTLLVPVVMIGWAFAESGVMAMKVTEASESALWNATKDPRGAQLLEMAADSTIRYADFDGRTSTTIPGGPGERKGLGTLAKGLKVECNGTAMSIQQAPILDPVLAPPTGMSCSASAELELFGGFTRKVCASGRPDGFDGPCKDGVSKLAIGDGSLINHNNCTVTPDGTPCENAEYFDKVKMLYNATGAAQGDAALELVRQTFQGYLPLYASSSLKTYLSFQGEDAPTLQFSEDVKYIADNEPYRWATTPFQEPGQFAGSYGARSNCYLGKVCDSQSIELP